MNILLHVNNQKYELEADPRKPLLHLLRDKLKLLGTKCGCEEGECGACTVVLNGLPVNSCITLVGQAHGGYITTIEGVAASREGQQVLEDFADAGAVQCGFCTPGIALSTTSMLDRLQEISDEDVRKGLSGHLCRCTGYVKIIDAVHASAGRGLAFPELRKATIRPIGVLECAHFVRPESLEKALELLADGDKKWRVLAGGTDLSIDRKRSLEHENLLDISCLESLQGICVGKTSIELGAATTYSELLESSLIQEHFPILIEAACQIGGKQIQNSGTVGGNIANGSPAADIVPPLMALEAELELVSVGKTRKIPLEQFYTGLYSSILQPDQLITKILLPLPPPPGKRVSFFDKLGSRKALAISKVSLAFAGEMENNRFSAARMAMGAVAEQVITAPRTAEILLAGELTQQRLATAAEMISTEARPRDDLYSTRDYCREALKGLLIRNLWQYCKE